MTWTKLQVSQRREIAGVAVSIVPEKETKTAARLFLRVARQLALDGGFPADDKSRADIFLGDGDNAGRMMVKANPVVRRRLEPIF